MTESPDERVNLDDVDIVVESTIYTPDGDELATRVITFGIDPLVVLEMRQGEEGALVLDITASMLESQAELLETLEAFTEGLRDALAQQAVEGEVVEGDVVDDEIAAAFPEDEPRG